MKCDVCGIPEAEWLVFFNWDDFYAARPQIAQPPTHYMCEHHFNEEKSGHRFNEKAIWDRATRMWGPRSLDPQDRPIDPQDLKNIQQELHSDLFELGRWA